MLRKQAAVCMVFVACALCLPRFALAADPVFDPAPTLTVAENSAVDVVVSGGSVSATDADVGQTVTYSIIAGNTNTAFKIGSTSGEIAVNAAVLDHESLNSYTLTIEATDDATPTPGTATQDVTITVTDVNETPILADGSASISESAGSGIDVGYTPSLTPVDVGQTHTYSITGGNDDNAFVINSGTGAISVADPSVLDHETKGTHVLTITVSDGESPAETDTATVTITVTDVNEAPILADASLSIGELTEATTDIGYTPSLTPVDVGQTHTYSITGGNDDNAFVIDSGTGAILVADPSVLDHETKGTHVLTITVSDGESPAETDTATVTITITDENEAPILADASLSIGELTEATTDIGYTPSLTPVDVGQTHTYSITGGNDDNAFVIDSGTGAILVADPSVLDHETKGTHVLTITVSDGESPAETDTATVTITVTDENEAPILADASLSIGELTEATTDIGYTPSLTPVDVGQTHTYSITGGNDDNAFVIDSGTGAILVADPSVLDHETKGTHVLTITVSDGESPAETDTATVTITITDENEAPILADASLSIGELTEATTDIGYTPSLTPVDVGQTHTYSITGGNDDNAFVIDSGTGAILVADPSVLDHETKGTHVLTITVSDGESPAETDTATVTITITDENEAPILADASLSIGELIDSDTDVGYTPSLTPVDVGQTHTYSITGGNDDNAFVIDSGTGAILVADPSVLDHETKGTHVLTITVSDGESPAETDTATVTITITDENEAPILADASLSIGELTEATTDIGYTPSLTPVDVGQTHTYSITGGNDDNAFVIDSGTGAILVADPSVLDHETKGTHVLTITVSDGESPAETDTATVTITITDENEAPILADASLSISEFTDATTDVGYTPSLTPVDVGQTHTYSITDGNDDNAFVIDSGTGAILVADPSVLDHETKGTHVLTITVSDGESPAETDTATVTITITDENEAPILADASLSIGELTEATTDIGYTPSLTPVDVGQTHTYSITGGNDDNAFVIDSGTGAILVADPSVLDHETKGTHVLTITVSDGESPAETDTATVTITITDENEAPILADASLSIGELVDSGTDVGYTPSLTPVDVGQTHTYSITDGNDDNAFVIDSGTGAILVAAPSVLDHELKGAHSLMVTVSDNQDPALTGLANVTITITDENEAPILADASLSINEFMPASTDVGYTPSLTPVDVGQTHTYSITGGNDDNAFVINSGTGAILVAAPSVLDHETKGTHVLTITVSDGESPAETDTATVTITVTDENEAPILADDLSLSIGELVDSGTDVGYTPSLTPVDVGQTHTYSITGGNDDNAFVINSGTGAISVAAPSVLDHELKGAHSLMVTVSDNQDPALTGLANVTITITDENEAPILADASLSISEFTDASTDVGYTPSLTPVDVGQTHTYSITDGNDDNAFVINSGTGAILVADPSVLDHETKGAHSLMVTVSDNQDPALTGLANVTITIIDENEAPILADDPSLSIGELADSGTDVGYTPSLTPVDVGQTHTYSITDGNDDDAFVINSGTGAISVAGPSVLDHELKGAHSLMVTVSDNQDPALTGLANVTITITDENDAPVVTTSPLAASIAEHETEGAVVITMSASDEDVSPVQSLTWSIVDGNDGSFAIDGASGEITVTAEGLDHETTDVYTLTVQVQDDGVGSKIDTAELTVTVGDLNDRPQLPDVERYVNESLASPGSSVVGTLVGQPLPGTDADADPVQTLTWSIEAGNAGGVFDIDATGQLFVAKEELDYETTSTYTLTIKVADNGTPSLDTTAEVTVHVVDLNDFPVVPAAQARTIDENSPVATEVSAAITASDVDVPAQDLVFAIVGGNTNDAFQVDGSGMLTVKNRVLNFEAQPVYELVVNVTDVPSAGVMPLTSTTVVTVTLIDLNDAPLLAPADRSIAENVRGHTVVTGGDIVATDEDGHALTYTMTGDEAFEISTDGVIRTTLLAELDFETQDEYVLNVTVTDNGTPPRHASAAVTVAILDRNDPPVVTNVTRSIDENSGGGRPLVGGILPFSDVDTGPVQTLTVTLEEGNDGGVFEVDASTGNVTVVEGGLLNHEAQAEYNLRLRVQDDGALSPGPQHSDAWVRVVVRDVNDRPVLADGGRSVDENSVELTVVSGGDVVASDEDEDPVQALEYSIVGGNSYDAFAIGASSGRLTVANMSALDYERQSTYVLTVRAVDDGTPALDTTATYTVSLVDVNDQPEWVESTVLPGKDVDENVPVGTLVGDPVQATDADSGTALLYSIHHVDHDGMHRALFAIDASTGQISVATAELDHERFSAYHLTVNVTDNGAPGAMPLHNSVVVEVRVNDVNDVPVPLLPGVGGTGEGAVSENAGIGWDVHATVGVHDDDPTQSHTFTITDGADGMFAIPDPTVGVIRVASTALHFESKSVYNITVRVTDNGSPELWAEVWVIVRLRDLNELPVFDHSTRTISEAAPVGTELPPALPAHVSDQDAGSVHKYYLVSGDYGDNFAVDEDTGMLRVKRGLNYEDWAEHVLLMNVTDNGSPMLWAVAEVVVTVEDANERPTVWDTDRTVNENVVAGTSIPPAVNASDPDRETVPFGTLTYTVVSGNDDGMFLLHPSTGMFTVAKEEHFGLNHEATPSYSIVVRVSDGAGLTDEATVTINVADMNDLPIITAQVRDVDENSGVGTLIGDPIPHVENDAGDAVTYTIVAGDTDALFDIDPASGQLSVASARLDHERQTQYNLTVRVTDNGVGELYAEAWAIVDVNDVNEVPWVDEAFVSVEEHSWIGTPVGDPLVAHDYDEDVPWSVVTFAIVDGDPRGSFDIDVDTGQIFMADNNIDFEVDATTYNLTVRVTDGGTPALSSSSWVFVSIIDVNDSPHIFADHDREVDENSLPGVLVGDPLPFTDQDGHVMTWTITQDGSGGFFEIDSSSGQISVATGAALDFEEQSWFLVDVLVTDNGSPTLSNTTVVNITVVDINDQPVVTASTFSINEDAGAGSWVGNVLASDQDSGARGVLRYDISAGNDDGLWHIDADLGVMTLTKPELNFEAQPVYIVSVRATDYADPPWAHIANMTVNLLDRNDRPVLTPSIVYINELAPNVTFEGKDNDFAAYPLVPVFDEDTSDHPQRLIYDRVEVEGPVNTTATFKINQDGYVELDTGFLDYEAITEYYLRVYLHDEHDPASPYPALEPQQLATDVNVTLKLVDNNEPSTLITPSRLKVPEGSLIGTLIEGDFELFDVDDETLDLMSSDTGGFFSFSSPTSERNDDLSRDVLTMQVIKPDLPNGLREVTVWIVENATGVVAVEPRTVIVDVADNNDPPVYAGTHLYVNESSPVGTVLGLLQATDVDPRQSLTYSVTSYLDFDNYLTTVATIGEQHPKLPTATYERAAYLVLDADFLDFEAVSEFTIKVQVTDDGMVNDQGDKQGQLTQATAMSVVAEVIVTVLDVPDVPEIADVSPLTSFGMSTAGGEDVTITGVNFGPLLPAVPGGVADVNAKYYNDEVEFYVDDCAVSIAYVSIVCKSRPGYGKGFRWQVQVGGQWSPPSNTTTDYALPNIARFSIPSAGPVSEFSTAGQEVIRLHGTQFGTVDHNAVTGVTYGPTGTEYTASLCNVTKSHSEITCLTNAGVGGGLLWVVEVGHQASETPTTSYGRPTITHISGASQARTEGGEVVIINGTNFGPVEESPGSIDSVIYGRAEMPTSSWYKAQDCAVIVPHVAIRCFTAPGVSTHLRWLVTIRGQTSELADTITEYGAPHIDEVVLVQASSGFPTSGDVRVTLRGRNFGGPGDVRQISFGQNYPSLGSVVYVGHGELQFTLPPGNGVGKNVSVQVANQVSNVELISYDKPQVTSMAHVRGAPPDMIVMDIFGRNFGSCCVKREMAASPSEAPTCECVDVEAGSSRRLRDHRGRELDGTVDYSDAKSTVVTVNGVPCEVLEFFDTDDTVRCTTLETIGNVKVSTGGLSSTDFHYFYKDYLGAPFIDFLSFFGERSTVGGIVVTVSGGSFGESGNIQFQAGDGLVTLVPASYTDTVITFILPEGQGLVPVRVSIMGNTRQSAPVNMEYASPEIHSVLGTSGDTSGAAELVLVGKNFGQAKHAYNPLGDPVIPPEDGFENVVNVGGRNCKITAYSHTQITCLVPPGTGLNKTIELRVARLCNDCTPLYTSVVANGQFHYHGPQVISLTPDHGPTVGNTEIVLKGSSLGEMGAPGFEVVLGSSKILDILSRTHDEIVFRTRAGVGKDLDISVTVDGQSTTRRKIFAYDPPEVHSVVNRADLITGVYGECAVGDICLNRTFDAFKASLILRGRNFGTVSPDALVTSILIGGSPCIIGPGSSHVWVSDTRLECELTNVRVGPKDIAINISQQQAYVHDVSGLRGECKEGFYGIDGEPCLPCPEEGAYCPGQGEEPVAIEGYWKYNRTGFVQCQPALACLGENTCKLGYREEGCTACKPKTHFRDLFTGFCEKCPQAAWMLLVGYMVGGMVLGLLFWKLYKKGPSVAAVGIAVDYFQILSIFADLNMGWPPSIVSVFEYASVTAANVEMTSPECSVSASYIQKWYFVMTLPLQMAVMMFIMHCCILLRKFVCRKRGSKTKHVATMLGIYLVSLNYLFLFLTKKAFEALSCKRLSEGGPLFLTADPAVSCDGADYLMMKQVAVLSIVAYGIGIPGIYCWLLFGNAGAIKVDQALRIRGLSGSRASNPYYDMQKRLRRLYFKFRPECYYWALVILARKFLIVVLSAEAGGKPMFAASATVLMLFGAYAAQMKMHPYRTHDPDKHDPYLDKLAGKPIEKDHMAQWKRPAEDSDSDDGGIGTLADAQRAAQRSVNLTQRRKFKRRKTGAVQEGKGPNLRMEKRDTGAGVKIKTRYLYDYNMLEGTFLCCAIFVLLAGMMFKSSEFEEGTPEYYAMEWGVLLLVFGSTIVCILTVVAELWASLKYYRVAKKARKKMTKEYKLQAKERARRMSMVPSAVELQLSPLERRRRTIVAAAAQATMVSGSKPKKGLRKKLSALRGKFDKMRKKDPTKAKRRLMARHQLTLKFVMGDDIDEEDGTPMRLQVKLDVQSDFMDFTYQAGVTTKARTVRMDVFDPSVEVVHLMLSTRANLRPARVVGTASIPINSTSEDMTVAAVLLKDHRMRRSGKLFLKAALRLREPVVDEWGNDTGGGKQNAKRGAHTPMIEMPGMSDAKRGKRAGAAAVKVSRQERLAAASRITSSSPRDAAHSSRAGRNLGSASKRSSRGAPLNNLDEALRVIGAGSHGGGASAGAAGATPPSASSAMNRRSARIRGMIPHNMQVGASADSVFQTNPLAPKHLRVMGDAADRQAFPPASSTTGAAAPAGSATPDNAAGVEDVQPVVPAGPVFHLNPIAAKHLRVMGAAAGLDAGASPTARVSATQPPPRTSAAAGWGNPLRRSTSGSSRSVGAADGASGSSAAALSINASSASGLKQRMRNSSRGGRRSRGGGRKK